CGILMMPVFSSHSRRASCSFAGRKVRRFLLKHQNFSFLFFQRPSLYLKNRATCLPFSGSGCKGKEFFSFRKKKEEVFFLSLFSLSLSDHL
ncbi:hypothetical protein, partial [Pontibacter brevis]